MHRRNWGLSHFLQRAKCSVSKAQRPTGEQISARIGVGIEHAYGRAFFVHDMKICTQTLSPSHPVEVNS